MFAVPGHEPYTVRFRVYTGEAWSLERIVLEGIEHEGTRLKLPNEMNKVQPWRRQVQRAVEEDVIRQIKNLGYANPKVYWQSKILNAHRIELQGNVEWGPQYQFGKVELLSDTVKPLNLSKKNGLEILFSKTNRDLTSSLGTKSCGFNCVSTRANIPEKNLVHVTFHIVPNNESNLRPVGGLTTEATIWLSMQGSLAMDSSSETVVKSLGHILLVI